MRNKVKPIRSLVACIVEQFEKDFFSITDYWEADLCAIGLRHLDTIVYVCCWEKGGYSKKDPKYYLEIEVDIGEDHGVSMLILENAAFDNVIDTIRDYFLNQAQKQT